MSAAFQPSAFQNDAFQVGAAACIPAFQRNAFQGFQTCGAAPAAITYGGVWMYGLTHWKRLRGELDEPSPELVETVARVVQRVPDDDVAARILLRLETERRGRVWDQTYLDALEAYRAGYAEYLDQLKVQDRARRDAYAQQQEAMARHAAMIKRRLALILLLDS